MGQVVRGRLLRQAVDWVNTGVRVLWEISAPRRPEPRHGLVTQRWEKIINKKEILRGFPRQTSEQRDERSNVAKIPSL